MDHGRLKNMMIINTFVIDDHNQYRITNTHKYVYCCGISNKSISYNQFLKEKRGAKGQNNNMTIKSIIFNIMESGRFIICFASNMFRQQFLWIDPLYEKRIL